VRIRTSLRTPARRLGAIGGSIALVGALTGVGLMMSAPAGATTITETFAGSGPTGPLELQLPETINQPASVTQNSNITISVPGSSQVVPTSQSGVPVISISGLQTLIPVPPQSTFFGNIVTGNWTFTPASGTPTSGPLTVTECTAPVAGTCTATTPNGTTFLGPGTSTPYLEATTGAATFAAGGTLTLPTWSFDVTASGVGSIVSTVSEFDTSATISLSGTPVTVALATYPAAVVTGCITTGGTCTQAPYLFQPIATTTIVSPPQAPVLQPQTGNVSAGQCTTINPLNGATEVSDTPNPATVTVTVPPTNGTATVNTATGIITYCNTGGTAATDTFQVTDSGTTSGLVSAAVTETINISYNSCSAGSGNASGGSGGSLSTCSLHQEIVLPVEPGQIVLSQASGLPVDVLGSSFCTGGSVPGITLNGNVQAACGALSPLTVTNATGLDTGWTLTGQVSDFNDPADPTLTCDTVGTYNNHCIPGGNLGWEPAGAVSHSIVPGDTAQVTAGPVILPPNPEPPVVSTNPILQGSLVQPNPVVEPSPASGLHDAPQTMCFTASGQSGGTFICGAGLELVVPASVAEPALGAFGAPAYQATITLTLF
jgi:hypothetical protein